MKENSKAASLTPSLPWDKIRFISSACDIENESGLLSGEEKNDRIKLKLVGVIVKRGTVRA